ncbi:MAG: S-adenosyl-L-methionine-dependent methyltransferase [Benjaminiella poitrasii]|nr:MAG: S-adenosyl-L-methionine-dependent methyltransferase [Benjaminiella poitrasii]
MDDNKNSRERKLLADHIFQSLPTTTVAQDRSKQEKKEEETWVYEYGAEKERDRQTRQHYVLKQVFNGNIHVQLNNPKRILDSACGVGLWSIEMAQEYPNCQVIGIDVVPPSEKEGWNQPLARSAGQKIRFQYGDILKNRIQFPDDYFDFIYQRDVATVLSFKSWPNLISEFHRMLKPGGQIQLVEYDLLFKNPGPVLTQVNDYYRLAASTIDVNPDYTLFLADYLKEAGFVDIEVKTYEIPIGEWPTTDLEKQHGYLYKEQMRALFKSMNRWWCSELKVLSQQEYSRVCAEALEEFEEFHSYACWKIFTAKKKETL